MKILLGFFHFSMLLSIIVHHFEHHQTKKVVAYRIVKNKTKLAIHIECNKININEKKDSFPSFSNRSKEEEKLLTLSTR